jgi:hypothetical protein
MMIIACDRNAKDRKKREGRAKVGCKPRIIKKAGRGRGREPVRERGGEESVRGREPVGEWSHHRSPRWFPRCLTPPRLSLRLCCLSVASRLSSRADVAWVRLPTKPPVIYEDLLHYRLIIVLYIIRDLRAKCTMAF